MYAKSSLVCHELTTPSDIIQVTAMQTKLNEHSLNIYVVYRSPNSSLENNYNLNEFLRKIPENSLILGDLYAAYTTGYCSSVVTLVTRVSYIHPHAWTLYAS